MIMPQLFALTAAVILALLMGLHILLAAGLPLGRFSWGGQHRVLPLSLRLGSVVSIVILGFAAWMILARAGMVQPLVQVPVVRVVTWVFAGFLLLNTLGNIASQSPSERMVMTPVSLFLAICIFMVALS